MSSRKTRVLIVSPSQGGYGGVEAFVLAVAAAARREPEMEVRICLRRLPGFHLQPDLHSMLRGEDLIYADRTADRDLVDAIGWADLVHLQDVLPGVALLAKLRRKPLAITVHQPPERTPSGRGLLAQSAAHLADERWYRSQFLWDAWEPERKRAGSRKLVSICARAAESLPPNERRGFAFVGRWIANKGIETLVDAYALAHLDREKWPLVMMGEGPLRSLIQYAIQKRQIEGVSVLGFVDEATRSERVRNARWLVVPPNANAGFSVAAVEARQLGVPSIVTRDGGVPESAGSQALVCEPADPQALARMLERAAGMDEAEYAERALRSHEELADELEPIDFYVRAYRRLAKVEPVLA